MTEQEIFEGNKLIAEFMGGIYESKLFPVGSTQIWLPFHNICERNKLKYHFSWDWLMPVLRKILDITFSDEDKETSDSSYFYDIRDCLPDINNTYRAIVDFIKLYNTQIRSINEIYSMKKATEYLEKLYITQDGEPKSVHDSVENILDVFKQIQIETIEATCKRCAEEAEADFEPLGWLAEQHMSSPFIEGEDYEVPVIRTGILEVADKLKKELE